MNPIKSALAATAIILVTASSAAADTKSAVKSFYDFLSNPGSASHAETFHSNVTADWQSIGNYSGKNKNAKAFAGQLGHFAKLIPDLNWQIEEMINAGDRVIVRGRASGTPKGPLFGVDGQGRGFTIMSIDIHTIRNGKISKSYHVEDWAGALGQLKGK